MFPELDPLCSFCGVEDESIPHLLWDCVHVATFWEKFCLFVRTSLLVNFSMGFKDVLFGCYNSDKNLKDKYFLVNLFIFLAKFSVHKCKFLSVKPIFIVFCNDLNYYLSTISSSNNAKALKSVTLCTKYNIYAFL